MNDEIDRILAMVKDATLTPAQATEMIAALRESARTGTQDRPQEPQPEASPREEARSTSSGDRWEGRRHRRHGRATAADSTACSTIWATKSSAQWAPVHARCGGR